MKFAADFRYIACEALRGKWLIAVLTAFVASLIGAQIASGEGWRRFNNDENEGINLRYHLSEETLVMLQTIVIVIGIITVVGFIITLIIGGAGKLGYARFNMNLVDGKEARFEDLFSQFHRLGDGFVMNLLIGVYTFLWTLLFIIPGIIKGFSYAMTPYILSEHPEYNPNYAITLSREMMDGNKFRLFCLHLSFIGWDILCILSAFLSLWFVLIGPWGLFFVIPFFALTFIGELFLWPYKEAANTVFYREVSGT